MSWLVVVFLCLQGMALSAIAAERTYSFDGGAEQWAFWGSGRGLHDPNVGKNKPGSLHLSTDWGEEHTAHYRWTKLPPGHYRISYYIQGQDIGSASSGASVWQFYSDSSGNKDVFTQLKGSFGWRKVEFSAHVTKELNVWFRIKAPGKVWIDDFIIEKASGTSPVSLGPESAPSAASKVLGKPAVRPLRRDTVILSTPGGRPFRQGEYLNFAPSSFPVSNWNGFDRIELEVTNPTQDFVQFFLVLADRQSNGYWNQLNHKTHLAPGKNVLNFSLTQYVGERGSVKFERALDLSQLTKMFVIADEEKKFGSSGVFRINNIRLLAITIPQRPNGILAFDFTSQKAQVVDGVTPVTTQSGYDQTRGHGFQDADFGRVEDAQYASGLLRYTIGLLKGKFIVNLPNGNYGMELIVDQMGYWDVPFWQSRSVRAQGNLILEENRFSAFQFVQNLLMFEHIEPLPGDHPYDLYTKKIFRPIRKDFTVTNGKLTLEFQGDASAIGLNSLVIWPKNAVAEAEKYLRALDQHNKLEFDWMTRPIGTSAKTERPQSGPQVTQVAASMTLAPHGPVGAAISKLVFRGGRGERPFNLIRISTKGEDELAVRLGELKTQTGIILDPKLMRLDSVIYQFTSPDLNHETYTILGRFLKPLQGQKARLTPRAARYLWTQVEIDQQTVPGIYRGDLELSFSSSKKLIPVEVEVRDYQLPKVPLPVGFLGLDPLPHTYFSGGGIKQLYAQYRLKALREIARRGFTSYSGLPAMGVSKNGSLWELDSKELDQLFSEHKRLGMSDTVFSYGGQYPNQLLQKKDAQLAASWKRLLDGKNWPTVVHTFSDEAGGYSDSVERDRKIAIDLKQDLPFIKLGGFSSMLHSGSKKLHDFFEYGLYSEFDASEAKRLEKGGRKWGTYNLAAAPLADPRLSFGPILYSAQKQGLAYNMEWHLSAFHNYPYYDMDGRESDINMFYPASSGEIFPAVKLELAAQGLELYRKLLLLESASGPIKARVASFLAEVRSTYSLQKLKQLKQKRDDREFEELNAKVNQLVDSL